MNPEMFNIKFWIVFQLGINLGLVVLGLYFLRNLKSGINRGASKETAEQIIGMIEPLLKEADVTAKTFEHQLKEKNRLISRLNERLDARIISLNLLFNRADAYMSAATGNVPAGGSVKKGHVYDQQEAILSLFNDGHDAVTIARKLNLPKGEVDLVIDLKRKFSNLG